MKLEDHLKKLVPRLRYKARPEMHDRVLGSILEILEEQKTKTSTTIQLNVWRTIMKSSITKIAAAAVIIISVVFLISFFDKAATPAYALEQTIEANHTIKTIHLRMFEGDRSIEDNEFSDYWIKYNDAGKLSNLRCNEHDRDSVKFTVWNEGVSKTWIPENNVVIVNRLNNTAKETAKKWEDFAKQCDPKLFLQWLYDQSKEEEAIEIKIDEPVSHYHLREHGDELNAQVEYLAYNQPIDPSMFELSGIPDNAEVIDRVNRLMGLEQGDLNNKEIAAKVVREGLEATIAKDYDEVSRLMEGVPGNTIEEFIEKEFKARLVRIIFIGQPEKRDRSELFIYVPCEIEIENEERGRCIVNIIATAKSISTGYRPDRRWIMYTDLQVSGLYIPSTGAYNAQDHIEGEIFFHKGGIVDVSLGMSKDEVLRKLGKPKEFLWGGESYTHDNLQKRYRMVFSGISFLIADDAVTEIFVNSLFYTFANGLGVGSSEEKIKRTFGDNFHLNEGRWKDFLYYEDKGLTFEIHKKNRAVMEFTIYQPEGDNGNSDTPDSSKSVMPK